MNGNMIFYSNNCNTCKNILTILQNENLIDSFKLICVDNMLDRLPPDMRVPLMRLINVPEPLYAQNIYDWISQIKFMRKQPQTGTEQVIQAKKTRFLIGYDADVMSKVSDSFAFSDKDMNEPLPQSYFGIGQEDNNAIFTPPKDSTRINKIEQSKILNELTTRRTHQDSDFAQHSKQLQMECLVRSGQDINSLPRESAVKVPKPKGVTLIKRK